MEHDLISRSAVLDVINKERRFIEELRETTFDNEDRAHNTGELGCAIRLARQIKDLPAIDAVPVVHARRTPMNIKTIDGKAPGANENTAFTIGFKMPVRPIDANALCEGRVCNDPVRIAAMCADTLSLNTLRDAIYQDAVEHGLWDWAEAYRLSDISCAR